jgi:hypothetical protein
MKINHFTGRYKNPLSIKIFNPDGSQTTGGRVKS